MLEYLKTASTLATRTVAQEVRHMITQAMHRSGALTVSTIPWPPLLPVVTPDNIAEVEAQLVDWEAERDELEARQRKARLGLMPHDEARLRYLRDTCKSVRNNVEIIRRMQGSANGNGGA
jgi:hypothetical protein